MQDNTIRSLVTRVNSLPNKTGPLMHHSKLSPSMDALTKDVTYLRARILPGTAFEQCTIYRGTFGTRQALKC